MAQHDGFDLEAMFEEARADPPLPSASLSARIADDALRVQPAKPLWQRLMSAIGGPAGVGGLITATVAGFWIGMVPPADVLDPLVLVGVEDQITEDGAEDLLDFGWYSDEG